MSESMLQLASALKESDDVRAKEGEETIEVSLPARSAGTLYEKARSAIDYQEEHLLRRNAILRILRRYIGSDTPVQEIAEKLLKELVWAKHLPNKEVPTRLQEEVVPILEKYEPLLEEVDDFDGNDKEHAFKFVLDALSTEIEYAVTPPLGDEALVSYMYQEMMPRIEWDRNIILTDEQKDLLTYIAIHRTLLKSNKATLRFRVLTLYYPDWPGASTAERIEDVKTHLMHVIETVDSDIEHPVIEKLSMQLRRKAGVFHVLREAIDQDPEELPRLIDDPGLMDRLIARTLKKRTAEFRKRLRRTVSRSIIFLLITKSIFALIIELPYELLVLDKIIYGPLAVNILFPPILLAVIALTIGIPERKNAKDYQEAVRALLVGTDHEHLNVRLKRSTFSKWSIFFNVIYALTYLIVYGGIAIILANLHFTWVSIMLFLFFLSLVAFFGIRVRFSTRDIIVSSTRRGIFGTIFDIFMIPVVRAGRWLSTNVAKINVFIYFFDFILEAPVKVAIQFFDSWMDYIREKREEI